MGMLVLHSISEHLVDEIQGIMCHIFWKILTYTIQLQVYLGRNYITECLL